MRVKVLIVGTVPYNPKSTSRAFDSYFKNWDISCLRQVFSNTKTPVKGHCESLFQITDYRLLKRHFNRKIKTGKIFNYDDLPTEWINNELEIDSLFISKLYKFGSKKTPIKHLIRKILWKKRYWKTNELDEWLLEFMPECVFLSFSDDFFISEIALYVAKKFNIPIVASIGDDYYFIKKFSLSPFYHLYISQYRKLIKKVFLHNSSAIYIGDKIKNKYNDFFKLDGETVYLCSEIERREFKQINLENPVISYFGNIRLGRNESLNEIAKELKKINTKYILNIYSNEIDKKIYKIFNKNANIFFHGSISYGEVKKKMQSSDLIIIVEGFRKKDVEISRYSLSTKVADSLTSGINVFAYGSIECGAIEYLSDISKDMVCTKKNELFEKLKKYFNNINIQKECYSKTTIYLEKNHNIQKNLSIFENLVKRVVERNRKDV